MSEKEYEEIQFRKLAIGDSFLTKDDKARGNTGNVHVKVKEVRKSCCSFTNCKNAQGKLVGLKPLESVWKIK